MAGIRTAPTVGGLPNSVVTTIHLVDASGDKYSEAIVTATLPTNADIEAWVAGYQGATQASVHGVTVSQRYEGDVDPQNAQVGQRNSISDGVNQLYRDITNNVSTTQRLVAPIGAVMQGNQDIPLLSAPEFVALLTAQGTLKAPSVLQSAQFTGRRERRNNPRIAV